MCLNQQFALVVAGSKPQREKYVEIVVKVREIEVAYHK